MAELRSEAARQERTLDWVVRHRSCLVTFTPYELAMWETTAAGEMCSVSEAIRRVMTRMLPGYAEPVPAKNADVIPIRQ